MNFVNRVITSLSGGGGPSVSSSSNSAGGMVGEESPPVPLLPSVPVLTPHEQALVPTQFNLRALNILDGHEDRIWAVAWHPTIILLASAGGDRTIRLWAPSSLDFTAPWRCVLVKSGDHARTIRSLDWTSEGHRLAAASFDATISIHQLVLRKSTKAVVVVGGGGGGAGGTKDPSGGGADQPRTKPTDDNKYSSGAGAGLSQVVGADAAECRDNRHVLLVEEADLPIISTLEGHDNEVKCVRWCKEHDVSNVTMGGRGLLPPASPTTADNNNNPSSPRRPSSRSSLCSCSRDKSIWLWDEHVDEPAEGDEVRRPMKGIEEDQDEGDDDCEKSGGDEEDGVGGASWIDFECAGVLSGHIQDVKFVTWAPKDVKSQTQTTAATTTTVSPLMSTGGQKEMGKKQKPPPRVVLSTSYDDTIKHWEETRPDDWHCTQTLHFHKGTVWCCDCATFEQQQQQQELEEQKRCVGMQQQQQSTGGLGLDGGGKVGGDGVVCMVSGSEDGSVALWTQSATPPHEWQVLAWSSLIFEPNNNNQNPSLSERTTTAPSRLAGSALPCNVYAVQWLKNVYPLTSMPMFACVTSGNELVVLGAHRLKREDDGRSSSSSSTSAVSLLRIASVSNVSDFGEVNCVHQRAVDERLRIMCLPVGSCNIVAVGGDDMKLRLFLLSKKEVTTNNA